MASNIGYLKAKTDKASDEVYTPAYAVKPILKYIDHGDKPQYTVWCPFDTEESEYVKLIREAGHKVIASHIDEDKNFFFYEPEPSEYSNPHRARQPYAGLFRREGGVRAHRRGLLPD